MKYVNGEKVVVHLGKKESIYFQVELFVATTSFMFLGVMALTLKDIDLRLLGLVILYKLSLAEELSNFLATYMFKWAASHVCFLMKMDIATNVIWAALLVVYANCSHPYVCYFAGCFMAFDKAVLLPWGNEMNIYKNSRNPEFVRGFNALRLRMCAIGKLVGLGIASLALTTYSEGTTVHLYAAALLFILGGIAKTLRLVYAPDGLGHHEK